MEESGRKAHGVRFRYRQTRQGYEAERGGTEYEVDPATTRYTRVVEVPEDAENVKYRGTKLSERYQSALQNVR